MSSEKEVLKRLNCIASEGRPALRYRIQFVDKSSVDEAVQFMLRYFPTRENIYTSLGSTQLDEKEIKEFESFWREKFSEGISLGAFLEDGKGDKGDIIGCQIFSIEHRDNPTTIDVTKLTERRQKIFQTGKCVREKTEPLFTLYKCSSCIRDWGLAVASGYENRGIATEVLRALDEVCRRTNVPVAGILFTGAAGQKIASKCGFQILSELDLRDFKINGELVIPNPKWPILQWTAKKYF